MKVFLPMPDRPGHIGRAIRLLRSAEGLSQAQLATRVGITKLRLQKLEQERVSTIAAPLVERLAVILGTTAEELWLLSVRTEEKRARGRPKKMADTIDI